MKYNLETLKEHLHKETKQEVADLGKISRWHYYNCEKDGEVPSHTLFRMAESDPRVLETLPDDFMHYTSLAMKMNMVYYNISINKLAASLNATPGKIHGRLQSFSILYEDKEYLEAAFKNRFLIPLVKKDTAYYLMTAIDTFSSQRNYIGTLQLKVRVKNPDNVNENTAFNRAFSYVYATHDMSKITKNNNGTAFIKFCQLCERKNIPVQIVAAYYDPKQKSYILANTKVMSWMKKTENMNILDNIVKCKICGKTPTICKEVLESTQSTQGNKMRSKYGYYVKCKCGNRGPSIPSNSRKAMQKWNIMNK